MSSFCFVRAFNPSGTETKMSEFPPTSHTPAACVRERLLYEIKSLCSRPYLKWYTIVLQWSGITLTL